MGEDFPPPLINMWSPPTWEGPFPSAGHLLFFQTSSNMSMQKRKLSDMLGTQWSKEELERFYEAYRKYGKDWRKVAGGVRNRSSEMVEALYNMNKAYFIPSRRNSHCSWIEPLLQQSLGIYRLSALTDAAIL